MMICNHCGVELDTGLNICPLCGKHVGDQKGREFVSRNYPSAIIRLSKKEKKKFLWELSGVIAFSVIIVCTFVDLLVSKGLSWSLYTDITVSAIWIILTLFRFVQRNKFLLFASLLITVLTALFLIDLISADVNWFYSVGFPVTLAAFFSGGLVLALYGKARLKGLNIIALALIVLSGFCIGLEASLDKHMNGVVNLRWSLIAGVSVIPVAMVFLFYHYRLKKGKRLDSLFHV